MDELLHAGFTRQRISVTSATNTENDVAHEDVNSVAPAGSHTRMAMIIGGAIGCVLAAATVVIGAALTGGIGPSNVGLLLSAAAVGAVAGTFVGAMMSRGYEPEVADYHDQALRKGQFLVSVEESEGGPPLASADAVFQRAGVRSLPMHKG
ncbi:MAG TPA: hypothetical protein VMT18_07220 [Planctomycetota bacterium]|nr:hypothetical protein [Planctomycetota bacterium]